MFKLFSCKSISPLLWEFASQTLKQEDQNRIAAHLETCADCRESLEVYRETRTGLSVYKNLPVPQSTLVFQELNARIVQKGIKRTSSPLFMNAPSFALAGAFACGVLAIFAYSPVTHYLRGNAARPDGLVSNATRGADPTARSVETPNVVSRINPPVLENSNSTLAENQIEWLTSGQPTKTRVAKKRDTHFSVARSQTFAATKMPRTSFRISSFPPPGPPLASAKALKTHLPIQNDFRNSQQETNGDYVMSSIGSNPDEVEGTEYVMGSVPNSSQRLTTASYVEEIEDAKGL